MSKIELGKIPFESNQKIVDVEVEEQKRLIAAGIIGGVVGFGAGAQAGLLAGLGIAEGVKLVTNNEDLYDPIVSTSIVVGSVGGAVIGAVTLPF